MVATLNFFSQQVIEQKWPLEDSIIGRREQRQRQQQQHRQARKFERKKSVRFNGLEFYINLFTWGSLWIHFHARGHTGVLFQKNRIISLNLIELF